jgi:DNA-directed RNA polymerase specialized sigma24 family protein
MPADDIFGDLPPRQLQALSLRFGEGTQPMPYREVADRLGISFQAAHKLVRKGRRRLADVGIDLSCLTGRVS